MKLVDCSRPPKLFRYSERRWLERSLAQGEFRLTPARGFKGLIADAARQDDELCRVGTLCATGVRIFHEDGRVILPIGDVTQTRSLPLDYYLISFSEERSPEVAAQFTDADTVLTIHDPVLVLERLHAEIERVLPNWACCDGRVAYGWASGLGVTYDKPAQYAAQKEFRLTAVPPSDQVLSPLLVSIGSIESIADIKNVSDIV